MADSKAKDGVTVPVTGDSLAGDPQGGGRAQVNPGSPAEVPPETKPLPDVPPKGKVRLFAHGDLGSVTVDDVTITSNGADVDPEVAERAHAAALAAGYRLREEIAAPSGKNGS